MGLNYMELMEGIKMGIFGGDHSSIYMLAGAVACIAASISLISTVGSIAEALL